MVAPGEHLEFLESVSFVDRIDGNNELGAKVLDLLKNRPNAGIAICPGIWELSFTHALQRYALIHGRSGNRVSLMYIFYLPGETRALEDQKMEIQKMRFPKKTALGLQSKVRDRR